MFMKVSNMIAPAVITKEEINATSIDTYKENILLKLTLVNYVIMYNF